MNSTGRPPVERVGGSENRGLSTEGEIRRFFLEVRESIAIDSLAPLSRFISSILGGDTTPFNCTGFVEGDVSNEEIRGAGRKKGESCQQIAIAAVIGRNILIL